MEIVKPVYSVAQIQQIETAFETQYAGETPLMQRAGDAVAAHVVGTLKGMLKTPVNRASSSTYSGACAAKVASVLVLVGNGNNGGDGIVAALALQRAGVETRIAFVLSPTSSVIKHPIAQAAFAAFTAQGGTSISLPEALSAISENTAGDSTIIIDAIFGIGLKVAAKPIDSSLYDFIVALNLQQKKHVIALDLPSGIDAETGAPCLRADVFSSQAIAIVADETLTFIGHKAGLHTGDGVDFAGCVSCFDLQIPSALFPKTTVNLLQSVAKPFAHRNGSTSKRNVHKGTFGTACIIGGAPGMQGAGWLAARAALLCGAGKTHFLQVIPEGAAGGATVDLMYPEIMHSVINSTLETPYFRASSAIAIGPGLGQSTTAAAILAIALQQNQPLIIDADALTLIANDASLAAHCGARAANSAITILTPHPREAAILLACSTADVQQNRIAAAQKIAQKFSAIVVLKGAGSITADADENVWVNQSGNTGMASGGMGDVLTGLLCAAFCSGLPQVNDKSGAKTAYARATRIVANTVWLHGHAADCCVANGCGPIGLRASEVAEQARTVLNASAKI